MSSKVVHVRKAQFDLYIGRKCAGFSESIWQNPFRVEDHGRGKCIELYHEYLLNNVKLLHRLPSLTGKTLGCWCAPDDCHGHVLDMYVNPSPDKIRIMVTGSRGIPEERIREHVYPHFLEHYAEQGKEIIFIHGAAKGVDTITAAMAHELGWKVLPIPAIWEDDNGNLDRSAGFKRNEVMLALADEVVAIWDAQSSGTRHAIQLAKKENKLSKLFIIT